MKKLLVIGSMLGAIGSVLDVEGGTCNLTSEVINSIKCTNLPKTTATADAWKQTVYCTCGDKTQASFQWSIDSTKTGNCWTTDGLVRGVTTLNYTHTNAKLNFTTPAANFASYGEACTAFDSYCQKACDDKGAISSVVKPVPAK